MSAPIVSINALVGGPLAHWVLPLPDAQSVFVPSVSRDGRVQARTDGMYVRHGGDRAFHWVPR